MGYNYDDFDQVMDLITKEKYDDAERLLKSMQDHPDQADNYDQKALFHLSIRLSVSLPRITSFLKICLRIATAAA